MSGVGRDIITCHLIITAGGTQPGYCYAALIFLFTFTGVEEGLPQRDRWRIYGYRATTGTDRAGIVDAITRHAGRV